MTFALTCIGRVFANSLEYYLVDDQIFSGDFAAAKDIQADVFFHYNGNSFWWKLFFQDIKMVNITNISLSELSPQPLGTGGIVMDTFSDRICNKQVRGFYINPARGNRVRPLDEDSLRYLQSVDFSYLNLTLTGGLFVCSTPANAIYGYLQHTRNGETYNLVVWTQYDFDRNQYNHLFNVVWSLLFENETTRWYLRDSYGGIGEVSGSWLNVTYVCGDRLIEDTELCDDGMDNGKLNYCNATCNGIVTSVCGDAIVQTGDELCDEWSGFNWQAGHCNLVCNAVTPLPIVPPSNNWWGGGWGWWISLCSSVDCSIQPNSLCCTKAEEVAVQDQKIEKLISSIGFALQNNWTCLVVDSPYSIEITEAFSFAYTHNITSQCPITKANVNGKLLRKHAAKMVSQFALTVLGKKPDSLAICEFNDISNETPEMKYYAKLACKLGIMWLKPDGTPDTAFHPNDEVTRAQFGTMLSRLLYGNDNNGRPGKRYEAHLKALKSAGIMTKISKPMMLELRWYVMIMIERIGEPWDDLETHN